VTSLTQAQLAVVTSERDHLLVDAGAGSGKTTTVVQALCQQLGVPVIVEGVPLPPVAAPLALQQVAAITYTNQAAADLKRKLRAALRAGGRRDLAADVDAARIGTIHGFCGDLLRDFALRAGTRPSRRILDDGEGNVIATDAAHLAVRQAIEAGDVTGLDALLTGRKLKDVVEWVTTAAADTGRLSAWERGAASLRDHEHALLTLAVRAADLRREQLDREGVLDFDQMIVAARDLLADVGVRGAVQQRLRLLVLDEFQDVDPIQRDIAFLLGGLEHPDAAPTRLILVGDPKQSIYRFRRADVTLWNAVKSRFETGAGRVLPLNDNFRSKAAILGLVDATVGKSLASPLSDDGVRRPFEVDYQPLEPRAAHAAGDQAVEFIVIAADEDGDARKVGDCRTMEADAVANRIAELRSTGSAYGDMAILLAGWADVAMYESALKNAGIPAYVLRSEGFWSAREVLDCVLALRVLRDPTDGVALVGFLKSPFVGVRDDTLVALARAATGATAGAALYTVLPIVTNERPLLDLAVSLIDPLIALRDRIPTYELLQRLLDRSGYLAAAALDHRDGQQRVANVRKLIREAAATPDLSLGEFLLEVAEQRDREDKVAPERLYRERSDVVTITSIHSSKGLEWPVVFWCDLARIDKKTADKFLPSRESFCVRDESLVDADGDEVDPVYAAHAADLAMERRAEAFRLWYVASTRAKERLVLSGIPLGKLRGSEPSPARLFKEAFPALETASSIEYANHLGTAYQAPVMQAGAPSETRPAAAPVEPTFALPPMPILVPAGGSRLSASQLMTFAQNPSEWWNRSVRRFNGPGTESISALRGRAIATGVIVHEVLERLGYDESDLSELIETAIANVDPDAPEAESRAGTAYRAAIRRRVEVAAESPAWKALASLPSARRELSFTRVLADGSTISGALDLAAVEGGVATVLDVKTTDASGAQLAERYQVQGAVYSDAVRAIAGANSVTFTVLAVPAGQATEVAVSSNVDDVVRRLRE